jgi:hypothetical protein
VEAVADLLVVLAATVVHVEAAVDVAVVAQVVLVVLVVLCFSGRKDTNQ